MRVPEEDTREGVRRGELWSKRKVFQEYGVITATKSAGKG
jgi:hypothetical protein